MSTITITLSTDEVEAIIREEIIKRISSNREIVYTEFYADKPIKKDVLVDQQEATFSVFLEFKD